MKTEGKRIYPDKDGNLSLKPGEYGKDKDGIWFARPPSKAHIGSLFAHEVKEHPDGTITVSPSILIQQGDISWHGYLKNGIWEEI